MFVFSISSSELKNFLCKYMMFWNIIEALKEYRAIQEFLLKVIDVANIAKIKIKPRWCAYDMLILFGISDLTFKAFL